jgi:hypothetical protein
VPAPVAAGGGGAVDTGPNVPLVVGVTVGSAVVVAAVIVAIVLATSGSGGTMPQGPIVER